jgi:pimeloyl-ACP methyl ester carboxylesterase
VLVAPGLSPVPWIRRFERGLGLSEPLREALRVRLVAELGVTPEAVELARLPEPTTPTLLVQDADDAVASWRNLTPLLRAWPTMGVYGTRGHGHNEVLAAPEVVSTILHFMREGVATRAPRCGCGEAAAAAWCDRCQLDGFLVERESRAN